MMRRKYLPVCFAALLVTAWAHGEQRVRIATYNMEWLSSETVQCGSVAVQDVRTQGARLSRLQQVVQLLDADIVGLEEIRDRKAVELVFGTADWTIAIDDDSTDCQNLALAVRKPIVVVGAVDGKLNAGPDQFLFEDADNQFFPGQRDVLCVEVRLPGDAGALYVLVHHAKARSGGRAQTNERRAGAAREIVRELEQSFDEKDYVLLGDFNDNPDDASLNILETGDPTAAAQMENEEGAFLVDLAEPLVARDQVSQGCTASDVHDGRVDTVDPGSRQRNYDHRNDDSNTGAILFDQVLVPHHTYRSYVLGSAAVFDQPVAVEGPSDERASDHLPVYADFVFDAGEEEGPEVAVLRIVGLLPNPAGPDQGQEVAVLRNLGQTELSLDGWSLRDRAGNTYALSGSIGAAATLQVKMTAFTMPLNNDGDDVFLLDATGAVIDRVTYTSDQVQPGVMITLGE